MSAAAVLVVPLPERSGVRTWRSLHAAGYRVVCADPVPEQHRLPRGARPVLPCPDPTADPPGLRAAVEDICRREDITAILPIEDECQKALLGAPVDVGGAVICGPTADQYRLLCDKSELALTALRAGVSHPRSVAVAPGEVPSEGWPDLPVIVKPILSEPGSAGGEIVVCHSAAGRDATVARLGGRLGRVLVQEFLPGPGVGVQFVRAGGSIAAIEAVPERRWPLVTGMSSWTIYQPAEDDVADATARLLAEVDYLGGGQVQYIRGPRGPVVHDVNLRPPSSVAGAIRAGLDLPRLMVEAALVGAAPAPVRARRTSYVWLSGEVRQLASSRSGSPAPSRRSALGAIATGLLRRDAVLDPGGPRALATEVGWLAGRALKRARRR